VLVATQLRSKHFSAAVNQHATVEEAVFYVGAAPSLYNEDLTQLEFRSQMSSGVGIFSRELRELAVEGDWDEMARKELGCADSMCDLKLQWDCYESVARKRLVESVIDWEP
jgi:hypothetical protein